MDAAFYISKYYRSKNKKVILIGNDLWANWAYEMGIFDEVFFINRKNFKSNFFYRYTKIIQIRNINSSIAIKFSNSQDLFVEDSIIRTCGAFEKIGSYLDSNNNIFLKILNYNRWYTQLISCECNSNMDLSRNAEFIRKLTRIPFKTELFNLSSIYSFQNPPHFNFDIPFDEPYFVIFPGAGWAGREWPLENFLKVAELLHHATGWVGLVCGGYKPLFQRLEPLL